MKLYDNEISSAASRVRIALVLKGVTAERIPVAILGAKAEQRSAGYLSVNPQGLVPALLTDEGEWLTQSLAIVEYLDERYPEPPLLPREPAARAQVRAIALAVAAEIHSLVTPRVAGLLRTAQGLDTEDIDVWKRHWAAEGMDALEALLARRPAGRLSSGDMPTLADVFLFPQAVNAERAGLALARWPHIAAIVDALRAIPAFAGNAPAIPR
ncbi:Maleylpyruvate isomerase [Massilia sp. Bi118]|uniref:maleylacetoacetate isomerase n=1 Tax=Massilia sp. Bi118 TaxID=2822346 RepID=UPI001D809DFE|nr:maleylacetoacetate isomerase [Massilia sp. Bi118]CAH0300906.1 Maleylpyruvate isomerase [Massilia sp. Bi118]